VSAGSHISAFMLGTDRKMPELAEALVASRFQAITHAAVYWITSSALGKRSFGIARLRPRAVLRLITSSNDAGWWTEDRQVLRCLRDFGHATTGILRRYPDRADGFALWSCADQPIGPLQSRSSTVALAAVVVTARSVTLTARACHANAATRAAAMKAAAAIALLRAVGLRDWPPRSVAGLPASAARFRAVSAPSSSRSMRAMRGVTD
jgi:hypothetical protein